MPAAPPAPEPAITVTYTDARVHTVTAGNTSASILGVKTATVYAVAMREGGPVRDATGGDDSPALQSLAPRRLGISR